MKFDRVNWKKAYEWLSEKQALLVEASKKREYEKIRHLQISILKDFRTTAIAVRRVVTSSGSKTAGIDGVTATTVKERIILASQVNYIVRNPSTYKPHAVKRVWIPKNESSMRPLGIPTIVDRAVQAVYLEAIDPLVEDRSCKNSFGFRKCRSGHDAVLALRGKLIHPKASEWVLNADIKKCFDRIDHDFLLRSVPVYRKVDRNVIRNMLKAKIIDMGAITTPTEGTPQGGILSPVLCNIALNGLEASIKYKAKELCKPILGYRGNPKVHVVRYADDFIVIGPSKKMLMALRPYIESFLKERGLEISEEKSSLGHIWDQEFDFLGFTFDKRRFNYQKRSEVSWYKRGYKSTSRIIIRPSKKNLKKFRTKVADIIKRHEDLSVLVIKLNEYLRGWALYFAATGDSAEQVRRMHRYVLSQCWRKVVKIHKTTPKKHLKDRFFPEHKFYQLGRYVRRSWVFTVPTKLQRPTGTKDWYVRLFNLDSIRAPGKQLIPMGLNAYDREDRERLKNRYIYTVFNSGTVEKVCRRQKLICPACGESLANGENIEVHHVPSLKDLKYAKKFLKPNLKSKDRSLPLKVKLIALHKLCHARTHGDGNAGEGVM
jgi:RNA-directed DNA polymerase